MVSDKSKNASEAVRSKINVQILDSKCSRY